MNNVMKKWLKFSVSTRHILANYVVSPPIAKLQRVKVIVGAMKLPKETPVVLKALTAFVEVAYQTFPLKLTKQQIKQTKRSLFS